MRLLAFVAAIPAALLPHRVWRRLPSWLPVAEAAFLSGLLTLLAGMAVGIHGFLEHAAANVSFANQGALDAAMRDPRIGYERGVISGFAALSLFTFLLLTPAGWATLYLVIGGGLRAGGAWFDDPLGDPILTGIDQMLIARSARVHADVARKTRAALEGPETRDRAIRGATAGIPGCDIVIVTARRKPGWESGVVVYTAAACYRIGVPVERTIAGHLRTLYPLTEHRDLEAVRKSVSYDLPGEP